MEQREREEGGGGKEACKGQGGFRHKTKVAPIEAKASHRLLCTFLHTQLLFLKLLSGAPLSALDIREGLAVRERIHIQMATLATRTEQEC